MRRFTTLFGATTLAATATLSGFFLGLALGARAFGERSKRWRRPVVAFGLLEIGVGLGALLVGPILDLYRPTYPFLYARLSAFPAGFAAVKLVLALGAIGIPAFCMGGTLPAIGQAVAPSGGRLGLRAGGLYAVNLLGAALGTLAVPFVLLPRLGLHVTYACAAGGSLAVGLAACAIGRARAAGGPREPAARDRPRPASAPPAARVALGVAGLSGLCTLALQALWTRTFALVHENSLYSFAVVVFVFLAGLTGGAALARWALARARAPLPLLARSWVAAGLLVVASPRLVHGLTGGLAYLPSEGWSASLARLLLIAGVTMLPATVGLGMALPLAMELAGSRDGAPAGPMLGRIVAVNTLGAMAGPLLATFLLGPHLGLWWSLVVIGVLVAAAGAGAGLRRGELAAAAGLLAAALLLEPAALPPVRVRAASGERLVSVREGTHGTTAVIADGHDRWITVNNSYVLGGTAAVEEERWQAHLPLLLHPAPRRVAFLGMGTGITAGAALLHPVERLTALEIVPEVVAAARQDFADANHRLTDDPRVRVVIDDGRNHLAASPRAHDVVVGDLLVPWRPAEAPLYTREHYLSVRASLDAGGLFCQWLPVYQLSREQLAIILRTFVEVFPRTSLWRGNFIPDEPTLALVGHLGAGLLEPEAIDARVRRLAASGDPNPFLGHPAGTWLFLVGSLRPDAPYLAAARRNTDREPWVELLSPVSHAGRGSAEPPEALTSLLGALARAPLDGTPLESLDGEHRAWRQAGAALWDASQGRDAAGKERVLEILRTLPPELRRSLDVDR
jgi:spermidine synthase